MSIMSDEVNFLIYRYLQEAGYHHSAFSFGIESHIAQSNVNGSLVPPGALISIIQKGIQYIEGELCINDDGSLVDDLDSMPPIPLIDAVIPEALAQRAASLYRNVAQKTELARSLALSPADMDLEDDHDGVLVLQGHQREVFSCRWHPSSRALATGDGDATVAIWDLDDAASSKDHKMIRLSHVSEGTCKSQSQDITCLQWNADGSWLATASASDFVIRTWNTSGALVAALKGHSGLIFTVKWNSKSTILLSAGMDQKCIAWDVLTWDKKQVFDFHNGPVFDVDWQGSLTFASCSTDRLIYVCKIGSDKPMKMFAGHQAEINCVRWDPAGAVLASAGDDKLIKIWTLKQDQASAELVGHTKEVTQVEWNPGVSSILASASYDTTIRIWSVETGLCLQTLSRHLEPVNSIGFHPDGRFLVSGTLDGLVNIWSIQTGNCLHTHRCQSGVFEVEWSPDGQKIALSLAGKLVKVLDFRKIVPSVS